MVTRIDPKRFGQGWKTGFQSPTELPMPAPTPFREVPTPIGLGMRITPVIDLRQRQIPQNILKLIPESLARRHQAVPVELQGSMLVVAMVDPGNLQAVQDLQTHTGVRLQVIQADAQEVAAVLDICYKATQGIVKELEDYGVSSVVEADPSLPQTEEALLQTPVVKTLDVLLMQAIRDRASDIHIEPQPSRVRVRYRIDGVLQEVLSLPIGVHASLVSRIKILGRMNIAERRLPQDGQFTFKTAGKAVDIRVASIETAYGERVVMRLLDKATGVMPLQELGFGPTALAQYQTALRSPHGLILVSGPTGSGKTTTLYSSLNSMDHLSKNVVTIEDPIEYKFPDINQIQVNLKADLTFAGGLRALMRHDPDVILVGEIRDQDTARTAVQAALTGHLVLSSIHANDAEGVIYRLMHLGVEPFMAASALIGVVAQRMIRRVCSNCAAPKDLTPEERQAYQGVIEDGAQFKAGTGCQFCAKTGYRGRVGAFEVMAVNENIRRMILANPDPGTIKRQAIKDGMVPMLNDGLEKAKQGLTTPAEVLRNLYTVA